MYSYAPGKRSEGEAGKSDSWHLTSICSLQAPCPSVRHVLASPKIARSIVGHWQRTGTGACP
jgi:hypothetical protein